MKLHKNLATLLFVTFGVLCEVHSFSFFSRPQRPQQQQQQQQRLPYQGYQHRYPSDRAEAPPMGPVSHYQQPQQQQFHHRQQQQRWQDPYGTPYGQQQQQQQQSYYQLPTQNAFEEEEVELIDSNQLISKRTLPLPIISSGYASTNFQGGKDEDKARSTTTTTKRPTTQPKRRRSTTASTTAKPKTRRTTATTRRPTTTTTTRRTTTTTPRPIIKTLYSERLPEKLPNSEIQEYIREQEQAVNVKSEERLHLTQPHLAVPVQASVPVNFQPPPPSKPISIPPPPPPKPINIPPPPPPTTPTQGNNLRKLINDATGEPIELYTGELITADNNPDGEEHVFLSFSKPNQQQKGGSTKINNVVRVPPPPPKQEIYQAGYQQIDVPQPNANQPTRENLVRPEKYDPNQLHEDRPNLQGHNSNRDPLYPLGRPPQIKPEQPNANPPPLPPRWRRPHPPPPANRRKEEPASGGGGSFFDFLIPSFLKPKRKPEPQRPRQPPPPPPPQRQQYQQQQPYQQPQQQQPHQPQVQQAHQQLQDNIRRDGMMPMPPPPEELLALFPPPHELGGALNPIILNVDDFNAGTAGQGIPPLPPAFMRPKQPRLDDQQQPRIDSRLGEEFRTEEEKESMEHDLEEMMMMEDQIAEESYPEDMTVTLGAKMNTVNTGSNDYRDVVLPPRQDKYHYIKQQVPFVSGKTSYVPPPPPPQITPPTTTTTTETPLPPPPMPYQSPPVTYPQQEMDPTSVVSLPKQLYIYRQKLQRDPQFHENLTKAHVYHSEQPTSAELDAQPQREEIDYADYDSNKPVSYLQDSNPFNFRPAQPLPLGPRPSLHNVLYGQEEDESEEVTTESAPIIPLPPQPPVDQIAPAAKPLIGKPKIGKPEMILVYKPEPTRSTTSRTTTTTGTTTASTTITTSTETTTTLTSSQSSSYKTPIIIEEEDLEGASDESIADHISSLLKQYMTTTPKSTQDAPKQMSSSAENDNLNVVEYLTPEGETKTVNENDQDDDVDEENEVMPKQGLEVIVLAGDDADKFVDEISVDEQQEQPEEKISEVDGVTVDYWDDDFDFVPSTPDRFYVVSMEYPDEVPEDGRVGDETRLPPELENLVLPKQKSDFLRELVENNNLILPQYGKDYQGTLLEKLFTPSASTDESEWHILDEEGRRVMDANEFLEGIAEQNNNKEKEPKEITHEKDDTVSEQQ